MADIVIRGMEMPPEGEYHMTLYVCNDGYAYFDVDTFQVDEDRFEAVPLPKGHGRLIDADSFEDAFIRHYLEEERKGNLVFAAVEIKQHLADMMGDWPTILEAEVKEDG